jgi:MFS-type transporter involved in bile tolerance (Atg22 family)
VIVIFVGLIGALIGGTLAKKRKGKTIDIIQYAGIYFLIFVILGLFLNTILLRLA